MPKTKPKVVNYRARLGKSAAGLLPCCRQVLIRMNSNRLLRLDDNKSAAGLQQAWSMLIVKAFYLSTGFI